jgi:prefoldin subunit 5
LVKEKKKIDEDTTTSRYSEDVAEYEKKVEKLNRKIADYKKRQEAFQKEANAVKEAVEKAAKPNS